MIFFVKKLYFVPLIFFLPNTQFFERFRYVSKKKCTKMTKKCTKLLHMS